MDKIIKISGYEIPVAVNAAALLKYKKHFGRDGFVDMMKLTAAAGSVAPNEPAGIDLDFVYRFLWVFALSADPEIEPFEQYFEQFDVAPVDFVTEAIPAVVDLLTQNASTTVKPRKKQKPPEGASQ